MASLVLEPMPRYLPAQGAWNGQRVVLGTGEILLGPVLRGREAALPITGDPGKWQVVERKSEGVVVAIDGAGQQNPAGAKDPCFTDARGEGEEPW
jgi:hypothetical protein